MWPLRLGMVRLECAEVVGGGGLGHVVFGEIRARERQRVERELRFEDEDGGLGVGKRLSSLDEYWDGDAGRLRR